MSVSRRALLTGRWGAALPEAPRRRVARVDPGRCVAFCATCVERCPVPGALVRVDGRPVVQAACDGCGVCVDACPSPFGPIEVVDDDGAARYSATGAPEVSMVSQAPSSFTRAVPSSNEPASS